MSKVSGSGPGDLPDHRAHHVRRRAARAQQERREEEQQADGLGSPGRRQHRAEQHADRSRRPRRRAPARPRPATMRAAAGIPYTGAATTSSSAQATASWPARRSAGRSRTTSGGTRPPRTGAARRARGRTPGAPAASPGRSRRSRRSGTTPRTSARGSRSRTPGFGGVPNAPPMISIVTIGNANTNVSTSGSRVMSLSSARTSRPTAVFIAVLRSVRPGPPRQRGPVGRFGSSRLSRASSRLGTWTPRSSGTVPRRTRPRRRAR